HGAGHGNLRGPGRAPARVESQVDGIADEAGSAGFEMLRSDVAHVLKIGKVVQKAPPGELKGVCRKDVRAGQDVVGVNGTDSVRLALDLVSFPGQSAGAHFLANGGVDRKSVG